MTILSIKLILMMNKPKRVYDPNADHRWDTITVTRYCRTTGIGAVVVVDNDGEMMMRAVSVVD
jgi:hypothetical protein